MLRAEKYMIRISAGDEARHTNAGRLMASITLTTAL